MKENFNIEELFKQKFDNFQPDVDPSVWANIQAGIGAGTVAAGGIATAVKIGLISGGIIAASVATWYFGFYEAETSTQNLTEQTVISEQVENPVENTTEPISVVNDHNDPLIQENQVETGSEQHNHGVNDQNNNNTTDLNAVNSNGSTSNTGNSTSSGNGSTNNPDNNNNTQHAVENLSNDTADEEDKHKEQLPAGKMEFTQSSVYAPSALSFVSNARNFEEVHWDFGDGTTAEGTEVKHTYSKPGQYDVRMSVVGEKTTYEESQKVVIKSKSGIDNVPNIITPNGDRINDFFAVKTTEIETFYITITDNRGNEVFTSNDKDFAWDGTDYSGQTVEKGVYTYVIIAEGKDGSVIKLPGQVYVQ